MNVKDVKEIKMRSNALKATAVSGGAESTSGLSTYFTKTQRLTITSMKPFLFENCW
jgi:hypothetical protein